MGSVNRSRRIIVRAVPCVLIILGSLPATRATQMETLSTTQAAVTYNQTNQPLFNAVTQSLKQAGYFEIQNPSSGVAALEGLSNGVFAGVLGSNTSTTTTGVIPGVEGCGVGGYGGYFKSTYNYGLYATGSTYNSTSNLAAYLDGKAYVNGLLTANNGIAATGASSYNGSLTGTGGMTVFGATAISTSDPAGIKLVVAGGAMGTGVIVLDATNGLPTQIKGQVVITGTLNKSACGFHIDHPLNLSGQFLNHSAVESPDMMNVYNGIATTDAQGNAVVPLPSYYQALNRDPRYQLTCIGQFAQAIISSEISNNQFGIKTDKPFVKVSWQVTGIRQDDYANLHRIQVEVPKAANERGLFIDPEDHGMPSNLALYPPTPVVAPTVGSSAPPAAQTPPPAGSSGTQSGTAAGGRPTVLLRPSALTRPRAYPVGGAR